jgi:hypothetical protein
MTAEAQSGNPKQQVGTTVAMPSRSISLTTIETAVKIIVAVAAAVISIATLKLQRSAADLQRQSEKDRQAAAAVAINEQRYLPLFRSITEVDAALVEISTQFGWPKYTHAEADQENRLGTRLAYLADSMYFPKSDFANSGPTVSLLAATDNASGTPTPKATPVKLSAADAVRLLSELMRIEPMLHHMSQNSDSIAKVINGELQFTTPSDTFIDSIPLADRAVPAFEAWLPAGGIRTRQLYRDVDITTIADSIDNQLIVSAKEVLTNHPELADKYVAIRNDVYRGRSELLPK